MRSLMMSTLITRKMVKRILYQISNLMLLLQKLAIPLHLRKQEVPQKKSAQALKPTLKEVADFQSL